MSNFDVIEGDSITSVVFSQPYLTLDDLTEITSLIKSRPTESGPLILRSAGSDFCTGLRRAPADGPQTPDQIRENVIWPILNAYGAMRSAPFPVIGAVRGRAEGLGFAIAASCDLIIAAEDAEFAVPELGSGVPPLLALSVLADILPRQVAAQAVSTGAVLTAKRMWDIGAVAELAPDADLERAVDAIGATLAGKPAYHFVKEYIEAGTTPERAAQTLGDFLGSR